MGFLSRQAFQWGFDSPLSLAFFKLGSGVESQELPQPDVYVGTAQRISVDGLPRVETHPPSAREPIPRG
jgi:hypothetical protein